MDELFHEINEDQEYDAVVVSYEEYMESLEKEEMDEEDEYCACPDAFKELNFNED